jgi:5,5'-dehydrodivanillate O-demethylase oxygenase subunit
MLSKERNALLTQIGPGTPMGELLRRYWHPVAAVSELDDASTKAVRLLGENLVLYKDLSGTYGLVDRHCAHRGADLLYGMVEECGLRCSYHGWRYGEDGRCLEQPFEAVAAPYANFKDKITITAYPVEAKAGLLWAYLGPKPAPLVPNWEPFTWKNGFVQIVFARIPCNWLQCQENSIDPVHFEWMHTNWRVRLRGELGPYSPRHRKIAFEEFDHGFIYRRLREDTDERDPFWTTGRVCLWPNALYLGRHFEWRVPIDDRNTLSITWMYSRVPKDREPYVQNKIPYWYGPIDDPQTGRKITSHIMNQDFIAWIGQGEIADRSKEHLGMSDQGVVMMRRRFFDDLEVMKKGGDPKAILRDLAENQCVELPLIGGDVLREGLAREQLAAAPRLAALATPDRYIFQAGQPAEIRQAYEEAMGIKMRDQGFVDGP